MVTFTIALLLTINMKGLCKSMVLAGIQTRCFPSARTMLSVHVLAATDSWMWRRTSVPDVLHNYGGVTVTLASSYVGR